MNESSSHYSWDESYMYPFHDSHEPQHNSIDPYSNPLPIPSTDVMHRRWNRRNKILEETKSHLLSHPHDAMADTGRNIAIVLSDREQYGPNATIGLCRFNRSRHRGCNTSSNTPTRQEFFRNSVGDRSPSTVLESPLQRRDTVPSDMDIVTTLDTSILTALGEDQLQTPHPSSTNNSSDDAQQKRNSTYLRRVTYPISISHEIRTFGEYCTATKYHSAYLTHLGGDDVLDADHNLPASSRAVSTISVAFSPDGHTMASTHGDHTVKLSCCSTGRLLQSLEGHPRTPWTVKYHPSDSRILASGCLGHQVRVWNWETNSCLQMIRLECAIISLSFHPSGTILAIANGSKLHFWGINDVERDVKSENSYMEPNQQSTTTQGLGSTRMSAVSAGASRATRLTEMDQRHMLRCVHFPPDGSTLIIGGVNPMTDDSRRPLAGGGAAAGGSMSFYLRLWDFDVEKALDVASNASFGDPTALDGVGISAARRAISNPRTFVPRALLYNDGGFDIDVSGKVLCVCAEFFLPDDVHNAMELLHKEELAYELQCREDDSLTTIDTMEPNFADSTANQLSSNPSIAEAHSEVAAVLVGLNDINNVLSHGRSVSFREGMEQVANHPGGNVPRTPNNASPEGHASQHPIEISAPISGFIPRTPPVNVEPRFRNLSPPPPPGSRFMGRGILRTRDVGTYSYGGQVHSTSTNGGVSYRTGMNRGLNTPPPTARMISMRHPHPLSVISSSSTSMSPSNEPFAVKGRYVPHVVTVSLDTTPIPEEIRDASIARGKPPGAVARGYRPRLGQLLEACPLDATKASAVTCVKFSPSADFCLIGYGVREPVVVGGGNFHPVTAVYRVRGGMEQVSTMLSSDDDVNIARFHPDSGHSFVYGTKQGRVRVLSPRPWNFYGDN